ncbi:hypothetical protein H0H93_010821 [Arthromyces matolae]|nr:hypothetical protein H0H93_010821 [Arthromyces matolae]
MSIIDTSIESDSTLRQEYNEKYSILPGIRCNYVRYAIGTALVHSGQFNARGVEYPSYGYCNTILNDLEQLFLPNTLLVPQFVLEEYSTEVDGGVDETASISSVRSKAKGSIPDFALLLVLAYLDGKEIPMDLPEMKSWDKVKIYRMSLGLLCEVKRRPTRHPVDKDDFIKKMTQALAVAMGDLNYAAVQAFRTNAATMVLVLVAWAGEWFSWRIAQRSVVEFQPRRHAKIVDRSDEESSRDVEAEALRKRYSSRPGQTRFPPDRTAQRLREKQYYESEVDEVLDLSSSDDESSGSEEMVESHCSEAPRKKEACRYDRKDLESLKIQKPLTDEEWQALSRTEDGTLPDRVQKLLGNINKSTWSNAIQFGTEEGKEAFFLIYKILESQIGFLKSKDCPGRQEGELNLEESHDENEVTQLDKRKVEGNWYEHEQNGADEDVGTADGDMDIDG